MQNGKSDKWFERIILVFSYFFLFILYSIDLYVAVSYTHLTLPTKA